MIPTLLALSFVTALGSHQQPANDLAVSVMIRTDRLNGRGRATAGSDRGDEVIARVTTDAKLCSAGSGSFALGLTHDYSWELTARVVSRTPDSITVDASWKQLEGPASGTPARSTTLTLRSGESVVLETIRTNATPECDAKLEVEAGPRVRVRPGGNTVGVGGGVGGGGGGVGGSGGGGAGGRVGASGAGGGGGASTDRVGTRSAGAGGGGAAGALGTGGGGSGVGAAAGASGVGISAGGRDFALRDPAGPFASLPPGVMFNVEIWVMRKLPNGTERVEAHDRAENVTSIAKKFGPVSVTTASGNVSVTIGVDLRTFARAKDPLGILIDRDETAAGGSRISHGGTSRVSDVPSETEIVSLVLPATPAYVDQFSVRLKFTKPSKAGAGELFE